MKVNGTAVILKSEFSKERNELIKLHEKEQCESDQLHQEQLGKMAEQLSSIAKKNREIEAEREISIEREKEVRDRVRELEDKLSSSIQEEKRRKLTRLNYYAKVSKREVALFLVLLGVAIAFIAFHVTAGSFSDNITPFIAASLAFFTSWKIPEILFKKYFDIIYKKLFSRKVAQDDLTRDYIDIAQVEWSTNKVIIVTPDNDKTIE